MKRNAGRWMQLMLIAFVANGLGPFGLKVLAERGLAEHHEQQYLLYWYTGALAFALAAYLFPSPSDPQSDPDAPSRPALTRSEILLGAGMGVCSLTGQAFTGMALANQAPGHIVFPITTGGSLFLVAAAGIFLFKERVGKYGAAGIVIGVLALVILSV